MATAPVDFTDPIWERVGPALKWLEDEDRQAATAQAFMKPHLTRFLPAWRWRGNLRPRRTGAVRGRDVFAMVRGIPAKVLERRYDTRFRRASRGDAASPCRRGRGGRAVLGVVALTFYLVQSGIRAGNAKKAAEMVAALLDRREFEQAEGVLANLQKADASLLEDPLLVEARRRCRAAKEQEVERAEQFADAMDEIRNAAAEEVEPKAVAAARQFARGEAEMHASRSSSSSVNPAGTVRVRSVKWLTTAAGGLNGAVKRLAQRLGEGTVDIDRFQEELDGSRASFDLLKPDMATSSNDLREQNRPRSRRSLRVWKAALESYGGNRSAGTRSPRRSRTTLPIQPAIWDFLPVASPLS